MTPPRYAMPVVAALLATACTVGPDYVRPAIDAPAAWRVTYPQAADVANMRWWERFDDPVLPSLIDKALVNNLDLVIAAARVDAFIGQLDTTRAQLYPQLGYSFSAARSRASVSGPSGTIPGDPYSTLYQGALGADWQLDLFGRVQRQSEEARARVYATEQGRRGVVLTVVTSVANAYITLRGLDAQLDIARNTAKNYADTLVIFEKRHKGGVVSNFELTQVRSQYQQASAAIPALLQQIAEQENLISVLLGQNPGPIPRGKTIDALATPGIPADLPSSLLLHRPDILAAEQNLVAANASIGAAKALYFPQISLTGSLGAASAAFGNFLTGPASTWSVAAGLVGPLFNAGSIAGQVRTSEAATAEALANYRQTVLIAFRETSDALAGTVNKRDEAAAQAGRVISLREYARLARRRFDAGYSGYLEVIYAENELFAAELEAVASNTATFTRVVDVYKAVGGGWVDLADQSTAAGSKTPATERAAKQPLF
jgi:outer membrane protein, multidrug efflux system